MEFLQQKPEATLWRNYLHQGSFWPLGKGRFHHAAPWKWVRVTSFRPASQRSTECCAEYHSDILSILYILAPESQSTTYLVGRKGESTDDLDNKATQNRSKLGNHVKYVCVNVCMTAEGLQDVGNKGAKLRTSDYKLSEAF